MSRGEPNLRRTQQLFWDLITAPEGVGPALDAMRRRGEMRDEEIDAIFVGDGRLPAAERLDIYANMYFYRLLDCLAEDYPRLFLALGTDRFHNLITDYLLGHPSGHPSLRHLGRRLPEFIGGHAVAREFPYLADLARLDWARVEVFDAPDAAPLSRETLARLPEERAGEARFRLVPAFDLLRLEFDVVPVWRALQQARSRREEAAGSRERADEMKEGGAAKHRGATKDDAVATSACASSTDSRSPEAETCAHAAEPLGPRSVPRRGTAVRVWRSDFVVYHRGVDDEEARCLERVRAGDALGTICQRIAAGRSVARATERVGRILQGWLEDGILAGFDLPA